MAKSGLYCLRKNDLSESNRLNGARFAEMSTCIAAAVVMLAMIILLEMAKSAHAICGWNAVIDAVQTAELAQMARDVLSGVFAVLAMTTNARRASLDPLTFGAMVHMAFASAANQPTT